jgi:hypothetical protein
MSRCTFCGEKMADDLIAHDCPEQRAALLRLERSVTITFPGKVPLAIVEVVAAVLTEVAKGTNGIEVAGRNFADQHIALAGIHICEAIRIKTGGAT